MKFVLSHALCPEGMEAQVEGRRFRGKRRRTRTNASTGCRMPMPSSCGSRIDRRAIEFAEPEGHRQDRRGLRQYRRCSRRGGDPRGHHSRREQPLRGRTRRCHDVRPLQEPAGRARRDGNGKLHRRQGLGKAFEVLGKKAGFIGLGAIGRETTRICRGSA